MRIKLLAVFFLLLFTFTLSAQDGEDGGEQTETPFPQLVLYSNSNLFQLTDGAELKYKELKEKLRVIPENEKVLRSVGAWKTARWINFALMAGFATTSIIYSFNRDLPHADAMVSVFSALPLFSLMSESIISHQIQKNTNRAINNYNLYVMGIPIPVKVK